MSLYLVDSSIWIAAGRRPDTYLPRLLAERIRADRVATCMPVALEVLVGPPDADALEAAWRTLWANLRWLPVGRVEMETARRLLFDLAATTAGAHRRSAIDYMVAACAASADGVTVWHWDRDLTVICDHAGIAHEPEHDRAAERGLGVEPRDQARRRI